MRVGFEALTSLLPCLAFANFPRICEIINGPSREQRVRGWDAEFAPESGFVLKPRFYDLFAIHSAPFRAVAPPIFAMHGRLPQCQLWRHPHVSLEGEKIRLSSGTRLYYYPSRWPILVRENSAACSNWSPPVSIMVLEQVAPQKRGEGLTLASTRGDTGALLATPVPAIGIVSEQGGSRIARASPDLRIAARENGSRTAGIAPAHTAPTHR